MKQSEKKFKIPTSWTLILGLIILAAVFTHIIPAGVYDYAGDIPIAGSYHLTEANPQGLWDAFQAPIKGVKQGISLVIFVLILGGFLGIVFETEAINAALAAVMKKLKKKEHYLIPILMIIFATGGTAYGMSEEAIPFYSLLVPIMLAAGYDLATTIMVIFLGCYTGVAASLIDPFSIGVASGLAGISVGDGIVFRFLFFIVLVTWAILFTMRYAAKVKADPLKSVTYDMNSVLIKKFQNADSGLEIEMTRKRKTVLKIFMITFLIMVISIIPWKDKFGIAIFQNVHDFLVNVPALKFVIGSMPPLGDWYFTEMSVLFFISGIIIGIYYRFSESKITELFISGAKDLLSVSLMLGVAKGLSVILNDGMVIGTILHAGEVLLSGVNETVFVIGTYFLYFPMTIAISSTSGTLSATIPIIAPLADLAGVGRAAVVMAAVAGTNSVCFISPVCAVLAASLSITGVPYTRWLKVIWPFLLGVILISCVFLTGAVHFM